MVDQQEQHQKALRVARRPTMHRRRFGFFRRRKLAPFYPFVESPPPPFSYGLGDVILILAFVALIALGGFFVGLSVGGSLGVAGFAAAVIAGLCALIIGTSIVTTGVTYDTTTTTTTDTTTTTTDTTGDDGTTTTTTTSTTDTTTTTTTSDGSDAGSGGGDTCVVTGTVVSTPKGYQRIETLRRGDIVHAHNLSTQTRDLAAISSIVAAWRRDIVIVGFGDHELRCTPAHRFYTDKWIAARDLRVGDKVRRLDGGNIEIVCIHSDRRRARVHNLIVEGKRNYGVGFLEVVGSSDKGTSDDGTSDDSVPEVPQ